MRIVSTISAALACLALGTSALKVSDVKVVMTTTTGGSDRSYSLKPHEPLSEPLVMDTDSIFRLSFTSSPVPKYAHLGFEDVETGDSWTYEVPVKPSGKGQFDLKATAIPAALKRSTGSLSLNLYVSGSSPSYITPLATLSLPSSKLLPPTPHRHSLEHKNELDPAFRKQPEIEWTFSKGEKPVGRFVSIAGTVIVLSQVLLLLYMISGILPQAKSYTPSTNGYVFLLTLAGLEGLIVKYWINGRIYTFLPPFLGLAVVSAYVGKNALRGVQARRLASQSRVQ